MTAALTNEIAFSKSNASAVRERSSVPTGKFSSALVEKSGSGNAASSNATTFQGLWQEAMNAFRSANLIGDTESEAIAHKDPGCAVPVDNDALSSPPASQTMNDPHSNANVNDELSVQEGTQLPTKRHGCVEAIVPGGWGETEELSSAVKGGLSHRKGMPGATSRLRTEIASFSKTVLDSGASALPFVPIVSNMHLLEAIPENAPKNGLTESFAANSATSDHNLSNPIADNGQSEAIATGIAKSIEEQKTVSVGPHVPVPAPPAGPALDVSPSEPEIRKAVSHNGLAQAEHATLLAVPASSPSVDAELGHLSEKFSLPNARGQRTTSGVGRVNENQRIAESTIAGPPGSVPIAHVPVEQIMTGHSSAFESQIAPSTSNQSLFVALDSGPETHPLNWTHAGSRHAEAGYIDPVLGWVAVRADLHGGNVHASLSGSSADSAAVLGAQLAGLSAHLAEKQIAVEAVTVSAASGNGTGSGEMQQGTGQQGNGREGQPGSIAAGAQRALRTPSGTGASWVSKGIGMPLINPAGVGQYVSVRV